MMMKTTIGLLALTFASAVCMASPQETSTVERVSPFGVNVTPVYKLSGNLLVCGEPGENMPKGSPEQKDDPGYSLYKKGYDFILDEEWDDAIEKLTEVLKKHPASQYADDAMYWRAYAYKQIDEDDAKKEYREFIKKYPKSKYYDDAVADLSELDDTFVLVTAGDSLHTYVSRSRTGFSYRTATTLSPVAPLSGVPAPSMRVTQPRIARGSGTVWSPNGVALTSSLFSASEKVDKETQLKLDALYALGDKKEDDMSFNAMKEVAADPSQHRQLRIAAMDMLLNFKKHDPLPVFLDIAKKDTSEKVQNLAIDYIGMLSGNKNRSVETLTELFNVIPKYRINQLQTVLSSIAEIGNEKSVEFLSKIASANDNYDLRHNAIFYLGSIGNDKAREALLQVLKIKDKR